MSKKLTSILLILMLSMTMIGCKKEKTFEEPLNVLENTWDSYKKNDRFYAIGGDFDHQVENGPGEFDAKNTETLQSMLTVSESASKYIDEVAGMVHGMNTNVFTVGAYKVKEIDPFVKEMKKSILDNKWMCGSPEKMAILKVDGKNVVVVYGSKDNVKIFEKNLKSVYRKASVIVEKNID